MQTSDAPTPPPRAPGTESPATLALFAAAGLAAYLGIAVVVLRSIDPDRAVRMRDTVVTTFTSRSSWESWPVLAIVGLVLVVDAVVLGWSQSAVRALTKASRSARADTFTSIVHWAGWSSLVMTVFSGGALSVLSRLTQPLESMKLASLVTPAWLQVVVVFILMDFLSYWHHRLTHTVQFLWETHKYHHSATEFTILTGYRVHALDEAFHALVLLIPMAALGISAPMFIGVRLFINAVDLLQHSMAPWTYGWVGRWIVYSPVGHRIHHSADAAHYDQNYGDVLVIWDRLFGTWYGGNRVNDTIGVANNSYNQRGVVVEYFYCAGLSVVSLLLSLRTGLWLTEHQRQLRRDRLSSVGSEPASP